MKHRSLHILGSPGFLIGLSLLLLNDFVFKQRFHNAFTGKLSDFAGLFVFSLFWIAFFPRRRTFICIAIPVLFVFWKSAYAQFLIEGWNRLPLFGIDRTVDYTDLWALLIVPLSYLYCKTAARVYVPRRLIHAIAIVSLFAFTATQFSHKVSFNNKYQFQTSRKELLDRIVRLPKHDVTGMFWRGNVDELEIAFDSCTGTAKINLEKRENYMVITLKEMNYRCSNEADAEKMRQYFEKEFIDKLLEEPVRQSTQILSISSSYSAEFKPSSTNSK